MSNTRSRSTHPAAPAAPAPVFTNDPVLTPARPAADARELPADSLALMERIAGEWRRGVETRTSSSLDPHLLLTRQDVLLAGLTPAAGLVRPRTSPCASSSR